MACVVQVALRGGRYARASCQRGRSPTAGSVVCSGRFGCAPRIRSESPLNREPRRDPGGRHPPTLSGAVLPPDLNHGIGSDVTPRGRDWLAPVSAYPRRRQGHLSAIWSIQLALERGAETVGVRRLKKGLPRAPPPAGQLEAQERVHAVPEQGDGRSSQGSSPAASTCTRGSQRVKGRSWRRASRLGRWIRKTSTTGSRPASRGTSGRPRPAAGRRAGGARRDQRGGQETQPFIARPPWARPARRSARAPAGSGLVHGLHGCVAEIVARTL